MITRWPLRLPRIRQRSRTDAAVLGSLGPDADLRGTLELDSLGFLKIVEALSERTKGRIDEDDQPATMDSAIKFLTGR